MADIIDRLNIRYTRSNRPVWQTLRPFVRCLRENKNRSDAVQMSTLVRIVFSLPILHSR